MLKHISEYIPIAVQFPNPSPSIYGNWTGQITTFEQAKNILDIADIAREEGAMLSDADREIEKAAYNILTRRAKK